MQSSCILAEWTAAGKCLRIFVAPIFEHTDLSTSVWFASMKFTDYCAVHTDMDASVCRRCRCRYHHIVDVVAAIVLVVVVDVEMGLIGFSGSRPFHFPTCAMAMAMATTAASAARPFARTLCRLRRIDCATHTKRNQAPHCKRHCKSLPIRHHRCHRPTYNTFARTDWVHNLQRQEATPDQCVYVHINL